MRQAGVGLQIRKQCHCMSLTSAPGRTRRETWRRAHVWQLVKRLGDGLGVPALSPVVPLVVGPEGPTLQLSSRLLAEGMHVPAIRPPTVPPGTCRWVSCVGAVRGMVAVEGSVAGLGDVP